MEKRLRINLEKLPEEASKEFSGELNQALFDLPKGDVQPAGPLSYDLTVQVFGKELFVNGEISAPFEFVCVRTLNPFVQTIRISHYSNSFEIGDELVVDITDDLREEIILAFPAYPKCDQADVPMSCEINSSYLGVDKHPQERVNTSRTDGNAGVWDALDSLHTDSNDSP